MTMIGKFENQRSAVSILFGLAIILFLPSACSSASPLNPDPSPVNNEIIPFFTPSFTKSSIPIYTTPVTSTPDPILVPFLEICSPLQDISLSELPEILKNPYQTPHPGQDDGHHGVDFAYYSRNEHKEMSGLGIYSVLSGHVSGIINNRPPYGNAIIIETDLENYQSSNIFINQLPTPQPVLTPDSRLFCPPGSVDFRVDSSERSLYLLYAHLLDPPILKIGDPIHCGDLIGFVGNSGFSGNPHLHLETRLGPPGITFDSMGHYSNEINDFEMANYCLWRVSGIFQSFDPMNILSP